MYIKTRGFPSHTWVPRLGFSRFPTLSATWISWRNTWLWAWVWRAAENPTAAIVSRLGPDAIPLTIARIPGLRVWLGAVITAAAVVPWLRAIGVKLTTAWITGIRVTTILFAVAWISGLRRLRLVVAAVEAGTGQSGVAVVTRLDRLWWARTVWCGAITSIRQQHIDKCAVLVQRPGCALRHLGGLCWNVRSSGAALLVRGKRLSRVGAMS